MRDDVLSLLGLCAKAGKCCSGEFQVEKAVKERKAFLVIVAEDASDLSRKSYKDMCLYYKVPIYIYSEKESLGHCIGKEIRSAVAVMDEGFANGIVKKMEVKGGK